MRYPLLHAFGFVGLLFKKSTLGNGLVTTCPYPLFCPCWGAQSHKDILLANVIYTKTKLVKFKHTMYCFKNSGQIVQFHDLFSLM